MEIYKIIPVRTVQKNSMTVRSGPSICRTAASLSRILYDQKASVSIFSKCTMYQNTDIILISTAVYHCEKCYGQFPSVPAKLLTSKEIF